MNDRMPLLIDANVTGRSETDAGEPFRSSENVAFHLERTKRGVFVDIPTTSITVTFVSSPGIYLESGGFWDVSPPEHEWPDISEALVKAWASLRNGSWLFTEPPDRLTRVTQPTSTTIGSAAKLVRRHHRDERLRRMTPEARATYDRIRTLRGEIGPIDFDIVSALRDLRDDE